LLTAHEDALLLCLMPVMCFAAEGSGLAIEVPPARPAPPLYFPVRSQSCYRALATRQAPATSNMR